MGNERRRSTAVPPSSIQSTQVSSVPPPTRKKSLTGRPSTETTTGPSAGINEKRKRSMQLVTSPTSAAMVTAFPTTTTPTATVNNNSPTASQAFVTAAATVEQSLQLPQQKLPLISGKKPRRDDALAASRSSEAHDRKPSILPFCFPPDASRDAPASTVAALAAMTKQYNSSTTTIGNSSNTSRAGSIKLTLTAFPAQANNLQYPVNEIHGSLAQLYLTPISNSLSPAPHTAFSTPHFDGRSASLSNGTLNQQPGQPHPIHRRASSSNSSAARHRTATLGDGLSGLHHPGDAGSYGAWAAAEDSFLSGQPLSSQRTRIKEPNLSPRRLRNSIHSSGNGGDERPRPTFSPTSPQMNLDDAVMRRTQVPSSNQMGGSSSPVPISTPLSATATTLLATTDTVTVPLTPAGGRRPPTPPPLEVNNNNPHFDGHTEKEESEGYDCGDSNSNHSSSGVGGGRGSWNFAPSLDLDGSPPTPLVNPNSPPVIRGPRHVSRSGSGGGANTISSSSLLELSEHEFMPDEEDTFVPVRRSTKKTSSATTTTMPSAYSHTAPMLGSTSSSGTTASRQTRVDDDEDDVFDKNNYSSSTENSVHSVAFVSTAASIFEEQPPPPPPPPAQLNLNSGSGSHRVVSPLPSPKAAAPFNFSRAADESVNLFPDTNKRQCQSKGDGEGEKDHSSASASFSVRQANMASAHPGNDSNNSEPLAQHRSLFPSSHVSLTEEEPFMLDPLTPGGKSNGKDNKNSGSLRAGAVDDDEAGSLGLVRHGASYGARRNSWGGCGAGPPPLSLEPSIHARKESGVGNATDTLPTEADRPARTTSKENNTDGSSDTLRPPKALLAPPALTAAEEAEVDPFTSDSSDAARVSLSVVDPDVPPPPESSLIIKEHSAVATRLSVQGEDISSRQQELAESFRSRIQVGVRAPKRKHAVRRVSSSSRGHRRSSSTGGASGDGSSGGGSHRSSSSRSGSSSSGGSRRRSGNSRRSGKSSSSSSSSNSTLPNGAIPTFVRVSFLMLACAKLMKAVLACRARHQYSEVDAPRAAFRVQCAWRRRQQRRRIRERNAVQLLVPWARLHLQRLRKMKEASALLLQRVFRGQKERSFHQFLYARMQYNKALDVVLRAVRRWEAQKMLFRLRLQRDERMVLIGQCTQVYLQVFRSEQLEWSAVVGSATATLGTRPCVTTSDWVSGVAARTGIILNPAAIGSCGKAQQHLFDFQHPQRSDSSEQAAVLARTKVHALRRQLLAISQLESYAYLDPTRRTRKTQDLHASLLTVSPLSPKSPSTSLPLLDTLEGQMRRDGGSSSSVPPLRSLDLNEAAEDVASAGVLVSAVSPVSSRTPTVTDDDVVNAYIQLLIRIESAERVELERQLLAEHEAVLRAPTLMNHAVGYIVGQQLPLLFAPLLLAMSSTSMMWQAVRLFQAEHTARCQIISLYESMPLVCLSRPMMNPAAGQRHDNLSQLVSRAGDPWIEAEQNERRLYQEWTAYQQRSNCGTIDSKSFPSPRMSYGCNPCATTPTLRSNLEEESVLISRSEVAIPAPLFPDKPQRGRVAPLSERPSTLAQRSTGSIRVCMTASLRSASSDTYARVDLMSKTAIPCPKRRQRGPPLPLLRTLAPVITRGRGFSVRQPSFHGSCSSFAIPSQSTLRAPDPNNVTVSGTPAQVYDAVRNKGENREEGICNGRTAFPASTPPSAHTTTQQTISVPALTISSTTPHDFGLADKSPCTPDDTGSDNYGTFSSGPRSFDGMRRAPELHPLSANDGSFALDMLSSSNRLSSLRMDHSTTAAPLSPSPSSFPFQLGYSSLFPAAKSGMSGPVASQSPRPSLVHVVSEWEEYKGGDEEHGKATAVSAPAAAVAAANRYAFPWNNSPNSNNTNSLQNGMLPDSVDSLAPSPLGGELDDGAEKATANAPFRPHDTKEVWSNLAGSVASPLPRTDSWASSSSSSMSSISSFNDCSEKHYGATIATAKSRGAHRSPAAPLRRPPTPPPRRCYAAQTGMTTSTSPPPLTPSFTSAGSKVALETVATTFFDNTAAAADATTISLKRPKADELGKGGSGGRKWQTPDTQGSSAISNTNWALPPTIKTTPASLPFISPTSTARLTLLPERQMTKQPSGFTM